jgi:predicted DNA binding CopG/RHH family protein
MPKKEFPVFASEADEAQWWDEHQDDYEDYFDPVTPEQAEQIRRELANVKRTPPEKLAELEARVKAKTEQIAIRVPLVDLEQARALAARRGIGYQTFLKMLIREGLDREARRAAGE